MSSEKRRVVAIGIDAGEPSLFQRWIREGELPAMQSLLERGSWHRVRSGAEIGSGSVWPTFTTETSPAAHGIYGDWEFDPQTMALRRSQWGQIEPFWRRLARRGQTCAVFDVPFAPPSGEDHIEELLDWGAHDWLGGSRTVRGDAFRAAARQVGNHPFTQRVTNVESAGDREGLQRLFHDCVEGVNRRGEILIRLVEQSKAGVVIAVFTEVHRAGHYLWSAPDAADLSLLGIARAIDQQIGRVMTKLRSGDALMVFSLHGMRGSAGIPQLPAHLLEHDGYCTTAPLQTQEWKQRAGTIAAAAKRAVPDRLKKIYYRLMPPAVTFRLAQPAALANYDWRRTRAFALPSDQNGWIRLNLRGREKEGIVAPGEYGPLLAEIGERFEHLRDREGNRLVDRIVLPENGSPPPLLPDLILHWTEAAERNPVELDDPPIRSHPIGTKFSGQHAAEGFLLLQSGTGDRPGQLIAAETLGALIERIAEPKRVTMTE
ncbi:MAG TPA: alkaline phosphatase family protein [Thermoanaerobaculia bacterium]|nr:alkaline phosphatase family protein [Thermoanaerobaculia bacterium]